MLLVVDAGNTNVKFGVFRGETLILQWRLRMEPERTADEYVSLLYPLFAQAGLAFSDITGIVLASVVPAATPSLLRLARHAFGRDPLHVTGRTDLGLRVAYDPPDAVGADRLVDAAAAVHQYGAPCLVIDFGTATTFNAIAAPGPNSGGGGLPVYLGGAICLGIGVSLEALFARAAKIPPVELARPPRAIGGNTIHALQSGIVHGYAALVTGMVTRFRAEMDAPHCPVVATGGHAALIAHETDCITAVEPLLTLEGLRLVYARHHRAVP
ncbi:MAG: type III pantothenate kinase [Armatimonadetes bacterium]|nr:type III pantothenate kinase [Armatimonadota bacterium]